MIVISTKELILEIDQEVFDGPSPYNAVIHVIVDCPSFSVKTDIDSGTLQTGEFMDQIISVYDNLKGEAELKGNDGQKMVFSALKTGRIRISGNLSRCCPPEDFKLTFSIEIDQTDLKKSVDILRKNGL